MAVPSTSASSGDNPIRVMIVDDALVIRGMLSRFVEDDKALTVAVSVGDGERALKSLETHDVDVVILDIEMPRMDGLTALPKILEASPGTQVLMASTLTARNAEISMKALSLGAADYIPKPSSSGELRGSESFRQELVQKVKALGRVAQIKRAGTAARASGSAAVTRGAAGGTPSKTSIGAAAGAAARAAARPGAAHAASGTKTASLKAEDAKAISPKTFMTRAAPLIRPDVIAIGSSTGGPQALFRLLEDIGSSVDLPILITQHMPPTFTTILAEHISRACGRPCKEACDGDVVEKGSVYVAPGDYHMVVEAGALKKLRLNQDPPENFCRPAVDPMLRSVANVYGRNVLVVILTGMGSDGTKGAQVVVDSGGVVISQDEASSVVWGMPGAVAQAGLSSAVLPLGELGAQVRRIAQGGAA